MTHICIAIPPGGPDYFSKLSVVEPLFENFHMNTDKREISTDSPHFPNITLCLIGRDILPKPTVKNHSNVKCQMFELITPIQFSLKWLPVPSRSRQKK